MRPGSSAHDLTLVRYVPATPLAEPPSPDRDDDADNARALAARGDLVISDPWGLHRLRSSNRWLRSAGPPVIGFLPLSPEQYLVLVDWAGCL